MRENRLRRKWAEGRNTVNGWLKIPSAFAAELMAHQGWDSLTVDLQHGVVDYQDAVAMFQAISTTETVPLARVPWNEPGAVMKLLDAGAYGLICPMINNASDARAFVEACRFPPLGARSIGPVRAVLYAGADYLRHANETVLALAQIESREAMESLDDILAVEGLDGVYIGPADLGLALGREPRQDSDDPVLLEAVDRILAAAKAQAKIACMHTMSAGYARRMVDKGFHLVTISSDDRLLSDAAAQALKDLDLNGA